MAFLRELWALSPGLAFEYKRTVEPALAAIFMSVGVVVLEEVRTAWVADRSIALNTCAVRLRRALRQNALPKNVADQFPWPEARHMSRITCMISCLWRGCRATHPPARLTLTSQTSRSRSKKNPRPSRRC